MYLLRTSCFRWLVDEHVNALKKCITTYSLKIWPWNNQFVQNEDRISANKLPCIRKLAYLSLFLCVSALKHNSCHLTIMIKFSWISKMICSFEVLDYRYLGNSPTKLYLPFLSQAATTNTKSALSARSKKTTLPADFQFPPETLSQLSLKPSSTVRLIFFYHLNLISIVCFVFVFIKLDSFTVSI